MDTPLSIDILFGQNLKQEAVNYFNAVSWTKETEAVLIQHMLELLDSIKPSVKSLQINFNVEVRDAIDASSVINMVKPKGENKRHEKFTRRESEILILIMQGFTNMKIAERLFISFETVRSHRKNILIKTRCKNTASLINYYHRTLHEN